MARLEDILESILKELELANNLRWLTYEENFPDNIGLRNWIKSFRKDKKVGLKDPDLDEDIELSERNKNDKVEK
ncbi:hypothetical protein GOV13_02640 [Candidatus Pacearchaeota archaeon]|nr:hypothetical protein [Candidatus Pacearchaeota archaeon]